MCLDKTELTVYTVYIQMCIRDRDNTKRQWQHHVCGMFTNPVKRTSFEFQEEDGEFSADILKIDSRFVSLLKWLGENHINVRLSGQNLSLIHIFNNDE